MKNPKHQSLIEKAAAALFLVYVITLLMITVIRPWQAGYRFMGGKLNPVLFLEYRYVIRAGAARFIYLFFGNIIWFIPMGYYCVRFRNMSLPKTVLSGFAFSLFIELMQYVLGSGVSELDDLILNTAGCFFGCLLAFGVRRVKKAR